MADTSIRSMINDIRNDLLDHPPADAVLVSEYIVKLTALLGNVHEEIIEAEGEYIGEYNAVIDADPKLSADKAKMRAMATSAYTRLQTAKMQNEMVNEIVQGLKYRAKALLQEYQQSSNS